MPQKKQPDEIIREVIPNHCQRAAFAGGCFWSLEAKFQALTGVEGAISGYGGGPEFNPSYQAVCRQQTGHRETVVVYFDPSKISYEELLGVFWDYIDPTDEGGQFNDRGRSYQTAIFYLNQDQEGAAKGSKAKVQQQLGRPVATEIRPYQTFYQAEDYHQNFYCQPLDQPQRDPPGKTRPAAGARNTTTKTTSPSSNGSHNTVLGLKNQSLNPNKLTQKHGQALIRVKIGQNRPQTHIGSMP